MPGNEPRLLGSVLVALGRENISGKDRTELFPSNCFHFHAGAILQPRFGFWQAFSQAEIDDFAF